MNSEKVQCPICKGAGMLDRPKKVEKNIMLEKRKMAKQLRSSGYSIREIMHIMNYKSPLSIQLLIK